MMSKLRWAAVVAPLTLGVGLGAMLPAIGAGQAAAAPSSLTYHFPSPPIAPAGSIGPGQSVTFDLRVQDNGQPAPGGVAYIGYFERGHEPGDSTTVVCSGRSEVLVSSGTMPCAADSHGVIPFTYNVPAEPQAQGRADWVAQATAGGASDHAVEHYVYCTVYRFNPSPIAVGGRLSGGGSVPVTLTAEDGLNQGIANDTVYLSLKKASRGGSARVGSTLLTSAPTLFRTDANGVLRLTYTAPASPPSSGQDAIVVQDRATSPTEKNTDTYAFSSAPVLSVGDVTVVEGDQLPGIPAQFTVTVSPVQPRPVTVQYVTLCGVGDKGCGEDFMQVNVPTTVTIPANTTSTNVLVRQFAYIGGNAGETYNEGWYVQLVNPSVGVLGRSVGTGLLLPDVEGTTTALPYLYTGSAGALPTPDPGGVPLYFTVTLGAIEKSAVTFHYATANGSATAGTDYSATSGTATIPAGQTSAVIPVLLLPNGPPAADRSFTLTISGSNGPTISRATGTGTILAG